MLHSLISYYKDESEGGKPMHDVNTLFYLAHPEAFTITDYWVDVVTHGFFEALKQEAGLDEVILNEFTSFRQPYTDGQISPFVRRFRPKCREKRVQTQNK